MKWPSTHTDRTLTLRKLICIGCNVTSHAFSGGLRQCRNGCTFASLTKTTYRIWQRVYAELNVHSEDEAKSPTVGIEAMGSMKYKFFCTHCGQKIEAEISIAGTDVCCPVCGRTFVAPKYERDST
jgi:DNA-directed RNA polymerase subunit RPC12/RpoP